MFNEGIKDGQPKANPADVAEDLKKKFTKPEWLEVQTIKGYFSRLAALQRGQEISEEDTSNEDGAIAREEFSYVTVLISVNFLVQPRVQPFINAIYGLLRSCQYQISA